MKPPDKKEPAAIEARRAQGMFVNLTSRQDQKPPSRSSQKAATIDFAEIISSPAVKSTPMAGQGTARINV